MSFGAFAPLPLRLGGSNELGLRADQHARLAADMTATFRVAPFARFAYTKSGATVTVVQYQGRNGSGSAYAPTATVNGTGDVTWTWPGAYLDPYDVAIQVNLRAGRATCNGSSFGVATITVTTNTVRIRTWNAAGAAADANVSITVWGETGVESRNAGDYGGSDDKRDSETEGDVPYAATWYREFQNARGSAYSKNTGTLVHCENLALARFYSAIFSRMPEKVRANAIPAKSDEKLDYWVAVLGVPRQIAEPKWRVRQRCAVHYRATQGPTIVNVRSVLGDLLGDALVDIITNEGADLTTPPEPTYWPGVFNGPPSYSLGGGCWYSKRCHLLVQTQIPPAMEFGAFLQLVNVNMFKLLDTMLPAWATFSWVTFTNVDGFDGFFLDISHLDLNGLT